MKLSNVRDILQPVNIETLSEPLYQPELISIIKLASEHVKKNNAEFYFVYLPEPERYNSKIFNNPNYRELKIITELNINFIDIHDNFLKDIDDVSPLFPLDCLACGHFNEIGYKLTAEDIYKETK